MGSRAAVLSIIWSVLAAAVLAAAAGSGLDSAEELVHRDEGPSAVWAWPGIAGEGPRATFSGPEAIVGSVLLQWSHGTLMGLDGRTGRVIWTGPALGNRECGYPDVALDGNRLVAHVVDDERQVQLVVVSIEDGATATSMPLARAGRLERVTCSPCVAETWDESGTISLQAIDVARRSTTTRTGWRLVSEVAREGVLAVPTDRASGVSLLDARTLETRWHAEVVLVQEGWRTGPWWIVATGGPGHSCKHLVRLDARNGRVDGEMTVDGLLFPEAAYVGGRLASVQRATSGGRPVLSRLDPATGTISWSTRLPVGASAWQFWHVHGDALLVLWHDTGYAARLAVIDWGSGHVRGHVPLLGDVQGIHASNGALVVLRDDASLVLHDIDRLVRGAGPH